MSQCARCEGSATAELELHGIKGRITAKVCEACAIMLRQLGWK